MPVDAEYQTPIEPEGSGNHLMYGILVGLGALLVIGAHLAASKGVGAAERAIPCVTAK